MSKFNKENYDQSFKKSIATIKAAEKKTKAELAELSRSILTATHVTGDHAYMNKLIEVLTPVNKRVAIHYLKEFSGFLFDSDKNIFGKKDKKNYDNALIRTDAFLAEPTNNIWTWAERNLDIEKKPFDLDAIEKQAKSILKKAEQAEIPQVEVFSAFLKAGLTLESIIAVMEKQEGWTVKSE